jgi:excisionase family DNA binding protein
MNDSYLTVVEVAERLRLCRASIYNLIARGALPPPVQFGRSARWTLSELEAHEWIPALFKSTERQNMRAQRGLAVG